MRKIRWVVKLCLATFGVFVFFNLAGHLSVEAASLNPNPPSTAIPADKKAYLIDMQNPSYNHKPGQPWQNPALNQWVAGASTPSSYFVNVNARDQSASLGLFVAAATTKNNGVVPDLRTQAAQTLAYSPSGRPLLVSLADNTNLPSMVFPNYQSVGSYVSTSVPLKIYPAGGFTESGTYHIVVHLKAINHWNNGGNSYGCYVGGSGTPHSTSDFGKCGATRIDFYINITVKPTGPTRCQLAYIPTTMTPGQQFSAVVNTYNQTNKFMNTAFEDGSGNKYILKYTGSSDFQSPGGGSPTYLNITGSSETSGLGLGAYDSSTTVVPGFKAPSSTGNYTFSWQLGQVHYNSSGAIDSYTKISDNCTMTIAVVPSLCSALTASPSSPESGQNFSYTVGANYSGGGSLTLKNITIKNAGGGVLDGPFSQSLAAPPYSYTHNRSGGLPAGPYTVNWTVAIPGGATMDCQGPLHVGNWPYLKVYGNDVAAGDAVRDGGSCSPNNSQATILTLDKVGGSRHSSTYQGSSSQLAAFALGEIASFFSGGQQSGMGAPASAPTGLTFGNYGQPLDGDYVKGYGGKSGGTSRCVPDYYSRLIYGAGGPTQVSSAISPNRDGFFTPSSGSVVTINGGIITGQHSIAVDGDVYINGNIGFWPGLQSLYVVASGNIYIDHNVTSLSGVFVAQSGTIYTCAKDGDPVAADNLWNTCGNQLTIDGAFIAKKVTFLRTGGPNGTVSKSVSNEGPANTNAGEVFVSSPALYLTGPDSLKTKAGSYDSITSLPPIL